MEKFHNLFFLRYSTWPGFVVFVVGDNAIQFWIIRLCYHQMVARK